MRQPPEKSRFSEEAFPLQALTGTIIASSFEVFDAFAAAKFGENRFVIVGMVDTSGYSAEIRARYEGFFITDSAISVGGETLSPGAYGFGFSNDGKLNIFDLANNSVVSVATTKDSALKRPRPLTMTMDGANVRLYRGRDYVVIGAK